MRTVEALDIQGVFRIVFDLVKDGEVVTVKSPSDKVVVMSEGEYNEITKAQRNAEYTAMLERSIQEAKNGRLIFKTLEDLQALEQ